MSAKPITVGVRVRFVPAMSWIDALKLRLAGPEVRLALIDRLWRQELWRIPDDVDA